MRLAILPLLLGLAAGAAPAQQTAPRWNPAAPENRQILSGFSFSTVEPVLNAIGARSQRVSSGARPSLAVTFANGRRALLVMSSCDAAANSCKALSIQANWTRIARSPPERTAGAIGRFNQRYSFAKAYLTADGRPALQRYLTADYGFVRGNLAVNLLVFANQSERFAADVLRPLEAAR